MGPELTREDLHALRKELYELLRTKYSVRVSKAFLAEGFKGFVGEMAAENAELVAELRAIKNSLR